jgi:hypothetical protein
MRKSGGLPDGLGASFSVDEARKAGVTARRLRGRDLLHPFHGVRALAEAPATTDADPYDLQRAEVLMRARLYSRRMRESEFFSHETAALIWGAPLPILRDLDPHVSVFSTDTVPRARGIHGHRVSAELAGIVVHDGLRVTTPAFTWAMLGRLELYDLVAVGDYFARVWRRGGYYRPNAGAPPLTTLSELDAAVRAGRRPGVRALRRARPLIRTDSWSRTETWTRLTIVHGGLPEPVLNVDQYDEGGVHLACIDLAYPAYKVAVEYLGQFHGAQFARDIERVERLRAAGWIVIQVASPLLFGNPVELTRRVRDALISRGWRG